MSAKLERKDREEIEQLTSSINKMQVGLSDGKEKVSVILRKTDDSRESDLVRTDLRAAIAKMTEAEEALRVAKSRLNNLL